MSALTHFVKELDRAKRMVDELETALKEERSRLRSLSTEQTDAQRHRDEVAFQLRSAEPVSIL